MPCKNITMNDGLPSNSIKCIYRDSRGLLWIGTEDGLCCYNGKEYKIYNENNGLKYNDVWSITEDNQQNLWFSLYGEGIAKFDGKKFTYYNTNNGLIHNNVRKIYFSKRHNCLILGTENGLSLFDGKKFKSFIEKTIIGRFQIMGISEDETRIFISANWHKTFNLKLDKDISKSRLIPVFNSTGSFSSFINNNYLYNYSSNNFLREQNLYNNRIRTIPSYLIWDFASDLDNNLYCAAWNVVDPKGGLYQLSKTKFEDITKKADITSTSLWCLYFDKNYENLWVGSIDKGIFVVDLSNKINTFEPSYFGLKSLEIQSLFITKENTIWIGARDNIIILKANLSYDILDSKTILNKIESYLKNKKLTQKQLANLKECKSRNGFSCFNIEKDNQGYIWVNTTHGIFCFDKKYKLIFYDFGQGNGGNIVFDNNEKVIYTAMYNNTFLNEKKFEWNFNSPLPRSNENIPIDIKKIAKDKDNIWFGSYSKGIFRYSKGQFLSMNKIGQLKEKHIKDLVVDKKGNLVIGTNLGNVYLFKPVNDKLFLLSKYRSNIEIIGNTITFIEEVNGFYFIGTNKGINVVKNNKLLKLLNKSEGLTDLQINDAYKDVNDNLVLATNNGLIKVNTAKIIKDLPLCQNKIEINNIKINGENWLKKNDYTYDVFKPNQVNLSYLQNNIEVYFSTKNLFNADKNVYRYKIIGLNERWSSFETIEKINLRGIPDGYFKLIIEGKNIGTGEVFKTKNIIINVIPPFWKTIFFIVIIVILVGLVSIILVKKRIQKIKKQSEIQNEYNKRLAETKMEALQSQMNPHFIFNAMNSIQNFIIDNKTDDALMYMGVFSKLIRQTLNNSSKSLIKLEDEIKYLKTYVNIERMRFPYGIEFDLIVEKEINPLKIEIPPMLIQPFVENAFAHAFDSDSKKSKLTIHFSIFNGELHCEITDNGHGIDKSNLNRLHESKGIKLVQERFNLFQNKKESIQISSEINKGTTILLKFNIAP